MAIEWYLLTTPYDQLSGYESEALNDFGTEGFAEVLESDIAIIVELCNYDLSERTSIKCIMEGTTGDTMLKTLDRQILVPIGTCHAGMYICYKNRYWLITGLVDDNIVYEKAVLSFCNHLLTWQKANGGICQRWASITDASQYTNGESSRTYYSVRSDKLLVLMPDDNDSLMLTSGHRYVIDRRCDIYAQSISDDVIKDTSYDIYTYKQTRNDTVVFNYTSSGIYEFMLSQDEKREDDGYYRIGERGYWLCGCNAVQTEPQEQSTLTSQIVSESNEIYNALEPTVFRAIFYDADGLPVEAVPQWDIMCDFKDKLYIQYIDNTIMIAADDDKLINKSFELLLSADGYTPSSIIVTIKAFI